MEYSEMGVCSAQLVGRIVHAPVVLSKGDEKLLIRTRICAVRWVFLRGRRVRHENHLAITASGAAARNILDNWRMEKRCYISGEMTIEATGVSVHAASLLWLDAPVETLDTYSPEQSEYHAVLGTADKATP